MLRLPSFIVSGFTGNRSPRGSISSQPADRRRRTVVHRYASEPLESRYLLAASLVYNGAQTLVPGATINVSGDGANAESEMSLVVNPANPLNLVGFSHRISTPIVVDVYASSDGGATWSTNTINNADDGFGTTGNRFDPAVAFDANGVCYIVYGHREPGTPNRTRLIGARSTDGGVTFGNYRTIDIQNDRGTSPALDKWYVHSGLDPASGGQALYVGYVHFALEGASNNVNDDRILLAGTRDAGNTWTAPLLLNDPAATGAETGPTYACPVVGRNGELAVSWHDMNDNTVMMDRDLDGLWAGPFTFGADITVRSGVNVVRSSILPPAQPERGVNAAPMLEVWRNTNWLLETHVEQFSGNDLDIWVGISTNFGDSWSFQRVEGGTGTDFNPWLQVDQRTGVFHVLYLSTEGDASGNDDIRPRIATSFNVGGTWQRGFLSAQTSNEAGGYPGDYLEYHGVAARDGTVHGLWPSRYGGGGTDLDAFTANAAYVSSIADNRLVIGETGAAGSDDSYLVRLAPNNSAFLEVFVDGVREFTGLRQSVNSIIFNPGGGTNSFNIGAIPGLSALTINGTNNADIVRVDALAPNLPTLNIVLAGDADVVTLGTGPTDFLTIQSPVNISGQTGSDQLNIGSGFAQALAANVSFDGGSDGFDTIDLVDTNYTATAEYDVNGSSMVYNGGIPRTISFANIDQIEFNAGAGADFFTVRSNVVVPIVRAFGNGGNDFFNAGDGAVLSGVRTFDGGLGTGDQMTIDVRNDTTPRTYNVTPTSVDPPGFTANTPNVEAVIVLAGVANDTIVFNAGTYAQSLTFDAGAGSDQVIVNGARMSSLTLRGGTDSVFDFLDVDDRTLPGNVVGGDVYADRIDREMFPAQTSQVFYSGFASVNWYQQSNQNGISVLGTPADIAPNFQFYIGGGSLDDFVAIYPRDAQGNPTLLGNVYFQGGGGPDALHVITLGSTPTTYRLYEPTFATANVFIDIPGNRWIGTTSTVEQVTVLGSAGNDTFTVEQLKSGASIQLQGGNGNDNCTIGNGDMAANLTSASFFGFDGQGGTNTFTIDNTAAAVTWNYEIDNGFIWASRPSTGYGWTSNITNLQSQHINGGSGTDVFYIDAVASGVQTNCNGLGGTDSVLIGVSANPDDVRGPVNFDAGASGGILRMFDGADTTGDIVHLTASTLGKHATDTLFGPGGSLTFNGLMDSGGNNGVEINLGSGADTVYAQPLPSARVVVAGNNPSTAPGDRINLALAGVQSPVVTHGSTGSVTSANRQTLSWNGMEQSTQPIDDVAPAPVKIQFKNGNGGRARLAVGSAIDVQFSEDVSGLLNPSFLSLQNLTTSSTVPAASIAVAWNAATLTATFTFPGYPGGVIPNGSYQAQLLAGLVDPFGNPTAASNFYKFIWVAGTSGNDDFRISRAANFTDVNVFFNNDSSPAFTGGPDVAQIAIAGDSGNDALVVDCTNLNPTPTVDGITFDGGDGVDSVKAKGSANVDGFTFLAGSIMPGATTITHPNVETQLYDGNGGYDSLGVYGTTVLLPVTQRFGTIDLNQSGKLVMQPNLDGVLVTRALTIAAGSTLDLDNSDLLVDYTGASQLAQVQGWINAARNGGTWNGANGISSTAARNANPRNRTLGAMEAIDYQAIYGPGATFAGQAIDTSAVLVKFTYYGDADFNGVVNFDDYSRIDAGFNFGRTGWINGDFDGNAAVNFDDYSLIDLAFNTQS